MRNDLPNLAVIAGPMIQSDSGQVNIDEGDMGILIFNITCIRDIIGKIFFKKRLQSRW